MPVFNDMLRIVPTNAPICLNIKNQEYLQKKKQKLLAEVGGRKTRHEPFVNQAR